MGRKLRDYVVVWNTGVSFIYLLIGTVAILYGIDSLHLHGDFTNIVYILKTRFTSLTTEEIILMIVFGTVWLAGITNFFYLRRSLLEYKTKSILAFVAAFTLVLVNALAITYVFYDMRLEGGNVRMTFRNEFINSLNWVGWSAVGLVIASGVFSLIGVGIMFKIAFKPVAVAENEFEKKERIHKEKEKEKLKKEHEKERKKSKAMAVRPRASRNKIGEEQMMFKSGDVSLEDEKLAEEIAERQKNPFLKEPTEEEKKAAAAAAAEAERKKEFNANGVPLAVVKENEVLSSNKPVLDQPLAAGSPNISPNISSEADDDAPAAAATPADVPAGGGAIDPSALGLDSPDEPAAAVAPEASAASTEPEKPETPAAPIISRY